MLFPLSIFNFKSFFQCSIFINLTFLTLFAGCKQKEPIKNVFQDDFNRLHLEENYFDTISRYLIINNSLNIYGAYNHPLWLKKNLPANMDLEFDTWSLSTKGDIKIELFGDGKSFALNKGAYKGTGYIFCQGGWNNSKTFIARKFEHARNLLHTKKIKVEPEKKYHWKIESRLKNGILILKWFIDNKLILTLKDEDPLYGKNNRYFAFSNWATDVYFDNLVITPVNTK
ncbi:MAG: hypothetical protein PF689_00575 [Deltaproteobacteria bacterium]|jgi:hypothetical protein|nr:hypothetical protein [Deltaproteobacteria bacterium]